MRRAVHERERGDGQLAEPPEHSVAELGDPPGLVPAPDHFDALEVGADREDERLAGDADGGDVLPGGHRVDGRVQLQQAGRAERARLGVVAAVVQGDEGERARPAGQLDIADHGPGDHLVRELRPQLAAAWQVRCWRVHRAPSSFVFCHSTVAPMPIPMHIVVRP